MKRPKPVFEINTMVLYKLGWGRTTDEWGLKRKALPNNAIYQFSIGEITYYITEVVLPERIEYEFHSYRLLKLDEKGTQKIEGTGSTEIKSNADLFKKIIETEACEESYARHFRINKLFR